jgi:hypothetical protein
MDDATVARQRASLRDSDDLSEGRHAIWQWHRVVVRLGLWTILPVSLDRIHLMHVPKISL